MCAVRRRVAVLGKRNHLFWGEHARDALAAAGHEVIFLPVNARPLAAQIARGFLKAALPRDAAQERADAITARFFRRRLAAFRPHIVFFVGAFFVRLPFYRMAASLRPRPIIAGWDGDNHAHAYQNSEYARRLDMLFESDKETARQVANGYRAVFHLPFAANPAVHRRLNLPRKAKIYFCGAHTPEREALLSAVGSSLVVRGMQWKRAASGVFADLQNGVVRPAEWVDAYNRHRAVVNFHQKAHGSTSVLNMRAFEIPACGALQICDARDELPEMFITEIAGGAEVAVYKSREEFAALAERVLRDEKWAADIAARGHARVLAEHTYEKRMQTMMAALEES